MKVSGKKDLVAALRNAPSLRTGEHIEATGTWESNAEHGLQFRVELKL